MKPSGLRSGRLYCMSRDPDFGRPFYIDQPQNIKFRPSLKADKSSGAWLCSSCPTLQTTSSPTGRESLTKTSYHWAKTLLGGFLKQYFPVSKFCIYIFKKNSPLIQQKHCQVGFYDSANHISLFTKSLSLFDKDCLPLDSGFL